jgi:predicted outer membrane repeat protein
MIEADRPTSTLLHISLLCVTISITCSSVNAQALGPHVRLVDANATGTPINGETWPTAFRTVQDALDDMDPDDLIQPVNEIWVANGTYVPTARTDPDDSYSATFSLISGVTIYGGFAGNDFPQDPPPGQPRGETLRQERSQILNPTILSGFMGATGCSGSSQSCFVAHATAGCNSAACCERICAIKPHCCDTEWDSTCVELAGAYCSTENKVYHVVTAQNVLQSARLDGFIIEHGRAVILEGGSAPDDRGGGMLILASNPRIIRCTFRSNDAANGGGGVHIQQGGTASNPVRIRSSSFVGHSSADVAGGMCNASGHVDLVNVLFAGNTAGDDGGGLFSARLTPATDPPYRGESAGIEPSAAEIESFIEAVGGVSDGTIPILIAWLSQFG